MAPIQLTLALMVPKIAWGTTASVHQELVHNHIGRVAVLVHASLNRVRIHRCNLDFGTGARAASRDSRVATLCVCVFETVGRESHKTIDKHHRLGNRPQLSFGLDERLPACVYI